jgi:hypothetical protein
MTSANERDTELGYSFAASKYGGFSKHTSTCLPLHSTSRPVGGCCPCTTKQSPAVATPTHHEHLIERIAVPIGNAPTSDWTGLD